jgi:hypothetical protein
VLLKHDTVLGEADLKRFGLCLGKGGFDKIQVVLVLLLEYGSAANGTFVPSATRIWPPPRQGSQQRVQKIRASDPQREI